jgi:hypothetical protein
VVDVHTITDIVSIGKVEVDRGSVVEKHVRVLLVVVFPGVLPDHVLARYEWLGLYDRVTSREFFWRLTRQ